MKIKSFIKLCLIIIPFLSCNNNTIDDTGIDDVNYFDNDYDNLADNNKTIDNQTIDNQTTDIQSTDNFEDYKQKSALIITTDFTVGNYRLLDLDNWSISKDLGLIHSDIIAKCEYNKSVIIERLGADALTYLEGIPPQYINQFSVGSASNPQDALIDKNGVWVISHNKNIVSKYSLPDGKLLTSIDISQFADNDGYVEPYAIYNHKDLLYISLQLLDRSTGNWDPASNSKVVIIDSVTNKILDADLQTDGIQAINLPQQNAVTRFRQDGDLLYIGLAGNYDDFNDGGIAAIDLKNNRSFIVVNGENIKGNIYDFVIFEKNIYAVIERDDFKNYFIKINLADLNTTDLFFEEGYSLVRLMLFDSKILIADRNYQNTGIYVWDILQNEFYLSEPINTGLPPYDLCILEQ